MVVISSEKCLYFGCTASKFDKGVSFFRLPVHNEEVTKTWILNCNRYETMRHVIENKFEKETLALGSFIVCEKHFDPKNIMFNNKRKLLFRNAVPIPYNKDPSPEVGQYGQPISKGVVCCVKGCANTTAEGNSRVNYYYAFPKEPVLRRKWLQNLGISQDQPDLYVCSIHFGSDAFLENPDKRTVLKNIAAPSKVNSIEMQDETELFRIFFHCRNCRRKRIPLTDKDKKKVIYYFKQIKRYSDTYESQANAYRKKVPRMDYQIKKREKELEELTAEVDALKEEVVLAEVELDLLEGGHLN